jgi:NUMOD3 motif.
MFGKHHSEKAKEKISRKTKNWIKLNPDHQTGNKNSMFGKQQSAESNKKRSESLKKYNSQFEKRPYNLTKLGRKRLQISSSKNIALQKTSNTDIEKNRIFIKGIKC